VGVTISKEQRGQFVLSWLKIFVPDLPDEFVNFRAVHLTDLHLGPATSIEHLEEGFRIVERLHPHALFLTGDYVQNTRFGFTHLLGTKIHPKVFGWMSYRREVRAMARELGILISRVKAPEGVFAVPGNHDYLEGVGSIRRMFPEHIHWLINSKQTISRGGSSLAILGVDDVQKGKPNLAAALDRETEKAFYNILLSHNPDIVLDPEAERLKEIDLTLCGHTHGGQIRLPLWGAMATRTKQKVHTFGLSASEDSSKFYVNNGLGYGLIGLRFLCPPEIMVLEFHKA